MIGFLLALVLVVGGASWEGAALANPTAVAVVVEHVAAYPATVDLPSSLAVVADSRRSGTPVRSVPRWRDLRCGGGPSPRAPDLAPAPRR